MKAFKSDDGQRLYEEAYDKTLSFWPVPTDSKWVETTFGQSHVVVTGKEGAPPLVLLPGMTVSGAMWACNIGAFAEEHRVYSLDTMGDFGKNRPTKIPMSADEYSQWLGETLDALGLDVVSLMGMSFGGWISCGFAQRQPKRVKKLILMAPAASFLSLRLGFIMRGMPLLIYPTPSYADKYMRYPSVPKSYTPFAEEAFSQVIEQVYLGWKHSKVRVKCFPNVFKDDALRSIEAPVMLLLGEQEKIYNPQKAIARATALIPNFTPMLLPDASHDIAFAQCERVNTEVISFLAST